MKKIYCLFFTLLSTLLLAQKESFKVMTYNLFYYKAPSAPCTPGISPTEKDKNFKTIFDVTLPDILCVNELGAYPDNSAARSVLNNVINTGGRNSYTSADYSNNNISSITNMLFYDSSRFVLQGQTYISSDIQNAPLARVIDFYRLYYKDPGLSQGNADTVFFTVVAAHLKAGQASDDRTDRESAAKAVMDYLVNDVPDDNVILCGDLNLYESTEGAFRALTANTDRPEEELNDPLNLEGAWNNNSLFAPIHTQSTHSSSTGCYSGGGMDDRFDFILVSNSLLSGSSGLAYKKNSYTAFGQDGDHFNISINSGGNSAVSPDVADALYTFSDHLPVIAEFEVDVSTTGFNEQRWYSEIMYTNPVGAEFLLERGGESLLRNLELRVYNLTGKLLYQTDWKARESKLKIISSSWPEGVYLLKVSDLKTGLGYTKKLIKE